MKKALFKIILPVCVLVLWMITCYQVCNKAEGFDYFLYWILVGCPYGIRKMCMFLVPKNFVDSFGYTEIPDFLREQTPEKEEMQDTSGHNVQRCKRKKSNKKGIVNQS